MNPVHTFLPRSLKIYFYIIVPCARRFSEWSLLFRLSKEIFAPCHHNMVLPKAAGGEEGFQIQKLAANVLIE
jgi:hypothetical protein